MSVCYVCVINMTTKLEHAIIFAGNTTSGEKSNERISLGTNSETLKRLFPGGISGGISLQE